MESERMWVLNYVSRECRERILNCDPVIQKTVTERIRASIGEIRKKLTEEVNNLLKEVEPKKGEEKQEGKFLSVKRFCDKYPSFKEGCLRNLCQNNPNFNQLVVRRLNRSVYISVDDFWKWMDDQRLPLHHKEGL